jgi:hypothetical protein
MLPFPNIFFSISLLHLGGHYFLVVLITMSKINNFMELWKMTPGKEITTNPQVYKDTKFSMFLAGKLLSNKVIQICNLQFLLPVGCALQNQQNSLANY